MDMNEELRFNLTSVKTIVTIPESGTYGRNKQGKICLGLTWPDEWEATHRVEICRTSLWSEDDMFVSKEKIPIQSLGGLLQKISEAVNDGQEQELVVCFCNSEELGDYIYIEVYDDYRE